MTEENESNTPTSNSREAVFTDREGGDAVFTDAEGGDAVSVVEGHDDASKTM